MALFIAWLWFISCSFALCGGDRRSRAFREPFAHLSKPPASTSVTRLWFTLACEYELGCREALEVLHE